MSQTSNPRVLQQKYDSSHRRADDLITTALIGAHTRRKAIFRVLRQPLTRIRRGFGRELSLTRQRLSYHRHYFDSRRSIGRLRGEALLTVRETELRYSIGFARRIARTAQQLQACGSLLTSDVCATVASSHYYVTPRDHVVARRDGSISMQHLIASIRRRT